MNRELNAILTVLANGYDVTLRYEKTGLFTIRGEFGLS